MNGAQWLVLAAAALCAATVGCRREESSAGSRCPTQPASPAQSWGHTGARNWVLDPPVVESERSAAALRLVCTAPSATEICCALRLREQIVGRSRFCDYPPGIEAVPAIGALDETNAEVLLGLGPDLVLISGTSRAITGRLDRLDLRYESLPDRSLADVFAAIERVGELTGRPEAARRLREGLAGDLDGIAQRHADVPAARVLLLLGTLSDPPAPPFVAGPGSFHDDLLRRAGHRNAAGAGTRAYGPLSLEMIARADPDVIIELDAEGRSRPGGDAQAAQVWSQLGPLRAVTNRRVHVLTGKHHFIPGPRIAQSFAELCQAIAGQPDD